MQLKLFARSIDAPKSLDGRQSFSFSLASEVIVKEGEFNNHHVTIISDEPPRITYKAGPHCYKCRFAGEADFHPYCIQKGNTYTFPYVQRNCVEFGKGVWD